MNRRRFIQNSLAASSIALLPKISDQKMPHMEGTAFLSEVKKISPRSIRILFTSYTGIESAIMAINEKLLDKYLTKPLANAYDFVTDIVHLLQMYQMRRTIIEQNEIIHRLTNSRIPLIGSRIFILHCAILYHQ